MSSSELALLHSPKFEWAKMSKNYNFTQSKAVWSGLGLGWSRKKVFHQNSVPEFISIIYAYDFTPFRC